MLANYPNSRDSTAYGRAVLNGGISLFSLMRPYGLNILGGSLLLLVTNLFIVLLPMLINAGISLIEKHNSAPLEFFYWNLNFSSLASVVAWITSLALIIALIRTLSRVVIFDIGRSIERDVRALIFNQICIRDDNFLMRHSVGDIMNHLTSDVSNLRMMTGFATLNIINIFCMFLFTVPLLFRIDFLLASLALLPFPLVMLAMSGISKKMFERTRFYQESLSILVNHVQENLLGAHIVRLFHQQEAESLRFEATNNNTFEAALKLARVRMLMMPLMRLVIGLAVALILFVGTKALTLGRISLGDFVEINARILQLTWPAMSVGFVMSIISRGRASFVRLNKLIALKPLIVDGPQELGELKKLRVHNLVLNPEKHASLSFSLERTQTLGIVGTSGSYKTTLLKSLYRRRPLAQASVFFDNHDINNLSLNSIYKNIAVVTQEPVLFHKSIRENICLARPDVSEKEIEEVLRITKLTQEVKQAPDGLDTIIGERGITLSGGQRQRVALARALLAKRALLILDDALSAVDADTENYIIREIKNYLNDSMVIIATHRLAALKSAHEILVLDQGALLARGCHKELLSNCKLYQELWGFAHAHE
jgi:ATP-binding cassette subfamily B protein